MSDVKEFKTTIKEIKAKLKKLNEEQKVKTNAARQSLIDIYTKLLVEHEVALRGLKIRARVEKSGVHYDEWWQWAMSLYKIEKIDVGFVVISLARDWDVGMKWELPDQISCEEKVEQLCGYKIYDRSRGRGDMSKDLACPHGSTEGICWPCEEEIIDRQGYE